MKRERGREALHERSSIGLGPWVEAAVQLQYLRVPNSSPSVSSSVLFLFLPIRGVKHNHGDAATIVIAVKCEHIVKFITLLHEFVRRTINARKNRKRRTKKPAAQDEADGRRRRGGSVVCK